MEILTGQGNNVWSRLSYVGNHIKWHEHVMRETEGYVRSKASIVSGRKGKIEAKKYTEERRKGRSTSIRSGRTG